MLITSNLHKGIQNVGKSQTINCIKIDIDRSFKHEECRIFRTKRFRFYISAHDCKLCVFFKTKIYSNIYSEHVSMDIVVRLISILILL
jgi:hypothetical protein